MFIYRITNTKNNKVYIGQTERSLKKRWTEHRKMLLKNVHHNQHLQAAWNKYGEESFTFEVIEQFDSEMNFDLNNLERYWIEFYNSMDKSKGYNKKSGGGQGNKLSDESKQKMSDAWTDERKADLSKRMSALASERTKERNPFYGKKHTDSFKKNLSVKKSKPVLCIQNNKVYSNAKAASADLKISQSYITHCCAGIYKTAKGMSFCYTEEKAA